MHCLTTTIFEEGTADWEHHELHLFLSMPLMFKNHPTRTNSFNRVVFLK